MRTKYMVLGLMFGMLFAGYAIAGGKWSVKGTFIEGCSCNMPCGCELTGVEMGCEGVGVLSLTGGSYNGVDLTGAKMAYAMVPGDWVRLYVDAKNDAQKNAAIEFAKGYYGGFGKLESASAGKIDIAGKDGKYTVKVNDGKIMQLTTEPVLGGDNKTPITHTNTKSNLSSVFMQAKTVSGTFSDGDRKFELRDSNSYFNTNLKSEGTIE